MSDLETPPSPETSGPDESGAPRPASFLERTQTRLRAWAQSARPSAGEGRLDSQALIQQLGQNLGKARRWLASGSSKGLITASSLALSTYFLADLTALLSESFIPAPPPTRVGGSFGSRGFQPQEDDSIIWVRNLISSKGLLPGEDTGQPVSDPGGTPVRTSLPFNLIGTLILRDELRSIATIEDRSAQQVYPVRIEDEIPGKAKILSIESRKVVFLNPSSGRREFVDLPETNVGVGAKISIQGNTRPSGPKGAGIEKVSPTQFNVARGEIDRALADLNQVLTQARAVPHFENGVPAGYKLFQIVPGSIYEKLGLQNGDLLCGINGSAMTDPGKAFEMLSELKTSSHLELCVKRDGRQSNFAYEIR
jgi:general secretion pathway protein C